MFNSLTVSNVANTYCSVVQHLHNYFNCCFRDSPEFAGGLHNSYTVLYNWRIYRQRRQTVTIRLHHCRQIRLVQHRQNTDVTFSIEKNEL